MCVYVYVLSSQASKTSFFVRSFAFLASHPRAEPFSGFFGLAKTTAPTDVKKNSIHHHPSLLSAFFFRLTQQQTLPNKISNFAWFDRNLLDRLVFIAPNNAVIIDFPPVYFTVLFLFIFRLSIWDDHKIYLSPTTTTTSLYGSKSYQSNKLTLLQLLLVPKVSYHNKQNNKKMKLNIATTAIAASTAATVVTSSAALSSGRRQLVSDLSDFSLKNDNRRGRSLSDASQQIKSLILKNKQARSDGERKVHTWAQRQRAQQLVNLVETQKVLEECDPYPDTGILSCGPGRYCIESALLPITIDGTDEETSLGGICVDETPNLANQHRLLQGVNETSLIDDIAELCSGNTTNNDEYVSCDCVDIDVEAYSGSVSCSYTPLCGDLPNICQSNITFCYSMTYDLTVEAQYEGTGTLCYNFTSPETFEYCYGVVYAGSPEPESCTMQAFGEQCNSCGFTQVTYPGDDTPQDCLEFDCSNTQLGLAETLCDYSVMEVVIADYLLYSALPCPDGCNLCGPDGYMTSPYANITLPTGEAYACGLLEIASLAGYFAGFEPDLCSILPPLVEGPCGCETGPSTPGGGGTTEPGTPTAPTTAPPATTPTTPTTPGGTEPTEAPVSTPTDPPSGAAGKAVSFSLMTTVGVSALAAMAMGWIVQA
jgi:hypothetical protein